MFRNYLVTALRNIVRHKLYSFINIAGLTVGLTSAIFIILFVRDQLSYDRWIPGTENLYRVETVENLPGKPPRQSASTPFPATQAMLDQIPEVQARTRLVRKQTTIVIGNRQFTENVDIVDPNFLQMIRLPLVVGDPTRVFARPESVVLSETTARKYFGNESPIGKAVVASSLHCDDTRLHCQTQQQSLIVTGVLRDLPHNTQFAAEILIPDTSVASGVTQEMRENWLSTASWAYVRVIPGADPNMIVAKFRSVIDHAVDPSKRMDIREKGSEFLTPRLTPFVDAHLTTDRFGGMTAPGNRTIVYGFAAIGVLILLIGCFNFTNLATARAMMRAREIALRKVVGARRVQLIVQFLGEAIVMAGVALVFALALVEVLLPIFDRIVALPIKIDYINDWTLLVFIAGIAVVVGLLSGAYPALMLSAIRPASTERVISGGHGVGLTRTTLLVLQFAASIGLGIAAIVIFAQISFSRSIDLGFRKDAVVDVSVDNILPNTIDSLAQSLRANPNIVDVAASQAVPFSHSHIYLDARGPGATSSQEIALIPASPDFMKLYGIKLLAGRLLSEKLGADAVLPDQVRDKIGRPFNVLINATAAQRLGYSSRDAIGKTLALDAMSRAHVTIVGVVADVKEDGPKSPVDATMYMYWRSFPLDHLSVRLRDGREQEALAFIDRTWHAFVPGIAIQRHLLEDDYNKQFQADERQGMLFGIFVVIAIFIACLGLFGLAAFTVGRRTREIGIRKIFGASTRDLVFLLLWQFSIPVLIANLIAWPVAWYYLHGWLEGFAYRISLSPLYFVGAGGAALVIAWATVFVHAHRVASANPIYALRYE